jgi:hypothetical protein
MAGSGAGAVCVVVDTVSESLVGDRHGGMAGRIAPEIRARSSNPASDYLRA